jgi:hypothetical protein
MAVKRPLGFPKSRRAFLFVIDRGTAEGAAS